MFSRTKLYEANRHLFLANQATQRLLASSAPGDVAQEAPSRTIIRAAVGCCARLLRAAIGPGASRSSLYERRVSASQRVLFLFSWIIRTVRNAGVHRRVCRRLEWRRRQNWQSALPQWPSSHPANNTPLLLLFEVVSASFLTIFFTPACTRDTTIQSVFVYIIKYEIQFVSCAKDACTRHDVYFILNTNNEH